jgi:cytochrome b subunit of formate dehydrogenase
MALKFASQKWAVDISGFFGGFSVLGGLHRFGAILTFIYFILHFIILLIKKHRSKKGLFSFIFDPEGLMPNLRDLREFFESVKWFFGIGHQPHYGKWTYWEKFDYFAVFWGVAMIGTTGLILWFPEFFTKIIPGFWINIATIIHSDEALLATGFIFTIHFYNTHFRPEKFPMDPVIFTGKIPLEEYKHERPRDFEIMSEQGKLDALLDDKKPDTFFLWLSYAGGMLALLIGFIFIGMVIYSMLFLYK